MEQNLDEAMLKRLSALMRDGDMNDEMFNGLAESMAAADSLPREVFETFDSLEQVGRGVASGSRIGWCAAARDMRHLLREPAHTAESDANVLLRATPLQSLPVLQWEGARVGGQMCILP